MAIWRGYGLFVMIVGAAVSIGLTYGFNYLPMLSLDDEGRIKIALLLSSAFIWYVGARINSSENNHTFFFMPIQWIGAVLTFLTIIYVLMSIMLKLMGA